jgi:hypothetical protein
MNVIFRRAAAVFFALHGLIHVMGFAAAWQLATLPEIAYRTTALNGVVEIGDTGARLLGVGWLVGAGALLVAAWGTWRNAPWALRGAVVAATVSMLICALGLPDAYWGLALDVAILVGAGLLVMGRSVGLGSPVR